MKLKLEPYIDGPIISVDLTDVSVIEEHGNRQGKSGFVLALITLRAGKELKIKLAPESMDNLIAAWENKPEAI